MIRGHLDDDPMEHQDELSDDDNAAMQAEDDQVEQEDPLTLALEDLMGRVVAAIDDVKRHSGVKSASHTTVHEELATMLRPVLEVAAHTGPSIARTYYAGIEGVEASCEEVYDRVVSDLVLPYLLEFAQSDTIPAKRAASLEFFHHFYKECQRAGSWLDTTSSGPNMGPYGPGGDRGTYATTQSPAMHAQQKRRQNKRLTREGEILRYWIQASIYCTLPGVFTNSVSEDAVASRGVIAASASLRPALQHISAKIKDTDDRGAAKVFGPVMKMVEGVLKKLFVHTSDTGDGVKSACIKFLEIVAVCCSSKGQFDRRKSSSSSSRDFSIEDLPEGHPTITREALESMAEYAVTTLRGLVLMGGQVKIDTNLLSDFGQDDSSPSSAVVNILKPAALAFLSLESSVQIDHDDIEFNINRADVDYEFNLSQKPYSLAVNAISMLAVNRPVFFKESAICLARRAAYPPVESQSLTRAGSIAIAAHLRASCLTLLRNALSVTTHGSGILHKALARYDMTQQADKALSMAKQTAALKTAGRAARNRAAMFYEWDATDDTKRSSGSKRSRETDDALAKMRAAKAARGLGQGIQLPSSMVDAVELILVNLTHLPTARPKGGVQKNRKRAINLDFVVDAVMTNGVSLAEDEGRWYERDGGNCWAMDTEGEQQCFKLDEKIMLAGQIEHDKSKAEGLDKKVADEMPKIFQSQCHTAAAQALSRILNTTAKSRDAGMIDFGNQVAAKLAWTLKNVQPSPDLKAAKDLASESVHRVIGKIEERSSPTTTGVSKTELQSFVDEYPLVSACLISDLTPGIFSATSNTPSIVVNPSLTLANSILNEAFMQDCNDQSSVKQVYDRAVDLLAAAAVYNSDQANDKPNDAEKKRVAILGTSSITQQLHVLPYIPPSSLRFVAGLCDTEEITKKAAESGRKSSSQTIAASAAINAAKLAAEKRATAALIALRDVAFQRSNPETRRAAVRCAVSVAAGHLPASPLVEDKALKLVMNVFFPKSDVLSAMVVDAATESLERAAQFSIDNYDKIQEANKEAAKSSSDKDHGPIVSDEEKIAMDKIKKAALLFMALCVRRPEMIQQLMQQSCRKKADILSKAVRENMPKLTRAVAITHGAAEIALKVADMAGNDEVPMLLAFLDNIAPLGERNLPSEELIEACRKIQDSKLTPEGKKDPRFLIPVVTGMKRLDLVDALPAFVLADDKIFMASMVHMASRLQRHALIFRDEPDPENPVLTGMTLCESFVFLHKMDFSELEIPQKRYLDVVRLCLEDDEVFTDTIVREALDYISGTFLAEEDTTLPLAYMRTIILTCSKHESLHNWICHTLLPRLIEGKVYTDRRQWEGWMRCARMLETAGVDGVQEAIQKLPQEQLEIYRKKYPLTS